MRERNVDDIDIDSDVGKVICPRGTNARETRDVAFHQTPQLGVKDVVRGPTKGDERGGGI